MRKEFGVCEGAECLFRVMLFGLNLIKRCVSWINWMQLNTGSSPRKFVFKEGL